jgi:putative peptide zinc metalloprotease protein
MTVLDGPAAGPDDASVSSGAAVGVRADTAREDVPSRADGVLLIGEMVGSGYREPPALARRGDGQTIQLTRLLYLVVEAVDGRRTYEEIAEHVSNAFGRRVTPDNVRTLVEDKLEGTGLLARTDGSQPEVRKSNPLLALRFKYAVTDPEKTRRLTSPFAHLFNPVVVVAVLAMFLGVCWWVLLKKGLASATHEAFDNPGLLLLIFVVTVLSAGFHEFGHAAAARRGGSTPGVMGAGIYLVWPAFYTDVTDSYRLGRGGRVRTDLGGLYFNAIVAVVITGVWRLTGYDALLLVVATQILQMIHQLTPMVRFDGYHVLADVTGVPDLYHRIRPTLAGLLPWRWTDPEAKVLKPWARAVVTLWVVVVVPMLLISLFTMVVTLPRIIGTAWASLSKQRALLAAAFGQGDAIEVAARVLAMVALAFPVLAIAFILFRLGRQLVRSVWRATRGRPVRRATAVLLAAALVAGLGWMWWPREGAYRPIMAYERGTLADLASSVPLARAAPGRLVAGQEGRLRTAWADGDARPTREHPQLAMILVPRGSGSGSGVGPASWVFPFNKPLAPGHGDNQALSVNTTDNTVQYDVAFALVWIDDGSPALNTNSAYAFASCNHCAAVSVGFQVVLVSGDNHTAVPQNISGAVNYNCVDCLTYALATQLFVTLKGPLSQAGMADLAKLWQEIARFGANIADVPLSEIQDRLTSYEQQILQLIEKEQGPLDPTATDSASPGAGQTSDGATATSSDGASSGDTATSEPSGSASTSASPTTEPSPTAGSTPTDGSTTSAP